ncbi:hypothetical protein CP8484711_0745 [Chlamydia psittaci 84-8471/1]|nr:hypothetical protein CP061683_0530 [Chlamydia psittaci 06-1683]EPP31035.1 hypothetical protein CP8484711_0745 [Chlamydia psittaci 84-8471/1]
MASGTSLDGVMKTTTQVYFKARSLEILITFVNIQFFL